MSKQERIKEWLLFINHSSVGYRAGAIGSVYLADGPRMVDEVAVKMGWVKPSDLVAWLEGK